MKKKRLITKMLVIFFILLFCLLILVVSLLNIMEGEAENTNTISNSEEATSPSKKLTIKDVIEKYDSTYINDGMDYVSATLSKDLFNEDGSSNQKFIISLVNDLSQFYIPNNFYIIDEEKGIKIYAKYDKKTDSCEVVINDVEDFYEKVDGKAYVAVDESEIVKGSSFAVNNYILDTLEINNNYFSSIAHIVGEGKTLSNGYTSYLDGSVKIRTVPTGGVRNIVFTDDYKENLTLRLNTSMSLEEIKELEPNNDFGSISEGYLGYRQKWFYLFFYKGEVSAYTYSYEENKEFEEFLQEYLETKDLANFVDNLYNYWMAYDYLKYDAENNDLKIRYSARGVDIDIKDNEPSGITFYSNYYFTDYTRSLVKKGIVSFKPDVDLLEKVEIERRNND